MFEKVRKSQPFVTCSVDQLPLKYLLSRRGMCVQPENIMNRFTISNSTLRLNVCFHSRLFPQFFGISHKSPWKRLEKKIRQNNCLSTRQNKHESWRTAFWSHNARRKEIFSTSGPTPRTKRAYGFVFKRKCSRTAEFVQLHK